MNKPMVERYEQILSEDPTSTVFVELAKTLIEQGQHQRAIDVCQKGLEHHRNSVVARVLWGKALINLGRPAEAMEQFDLAIAIDRQNPHAYNLIGEVLLHKGLYRSALPLLKKAVALQPHDGRVRQWLEQTQRALAGGPQPVLGDPTLVDSLNSGDIVASAPIASRDTETTDVNLPAFRPGAAPQPPKPPEDPFEQVAPTEPHPKEEVVPGLTRTFDALGQTAPPEPPLDPFDAVVARSPVPEVVGGLTSTFDALAQERPASEPTIIPSQELLRDGQVQQFEGPEEPPSGPELIRSSEVSLVPPAGGGRSSLLGDIPEADEPEPAPPPRREEVSPQVTAAIAKEFERELREKLAAQAKQKTFLQRHGVTVAIGTVAGLAILAFLGIFGFTRMRHQGRSLVEALGDARKLIAQDTQASYRAALEVLQDALKMDDGNTEAWARTAYAQALLFAEHGGAEQARKAALDALSQPGVREDFPGLALVSEYYLSGGEESARRPVLDSKLEDPEVHDAVGRILLAQRKGDKARSRLNAAGQKGSVRALVALGNYYREAGDHTNALQVWENVAKVMAVLQVPKRPLPPHPEAVLGAGEAYLELELDEKVPAALRDVEALSGGDALAPELLARKQLIHGRLLAAAGNADAAVKVLEEGVKSFKGQAFEFQMALGDANRRAGKMDAAQQAFEAALKVKPRSEEAQAALGRTLIDRDRPGEALKAVSSDGRRAHLVQGIANARLGNWKRARAELARTQVGGKFPTEAVIYLALADAAEGNADRAVSVLEKILAASKRAKAQVRIALGQVHWQRGALDKAKAQFEEAAKDESEYEGACALGRLLLSLGLPELAIAPLAQAVARNGSHGEALHALGRAYLATGKTQDALRQAEAWQLDDPLSAGAQRDFALALYHAGRFQDAEVAIARAVKRQPSEPEGHRIHAMVLFARGEGQRAFSALERANRLNPHDADTFCAIGHAFVRQGNGAFAAKAFEAAVREDAKSTCGAIGQHLAALPARGKRASSELAQLAKSAQAVWDRSLALAVLARIQLAQGSLKAARASAEEAVQLSPNSANAQLALGLVAHRQRDEAKAAEALGRAAELDPSYAAVRLSYADHLARGDERDLARAIQEYEAFLRFGTGPETARVKRTLTTLKKRLAQR